MNVCIPVDEDKGLSSTVCGHFGAAPVFLLVDTESGDRKAITNDNQHHAHGMCKPIELLRGEHIDAMVVAGMGMGALNKLGSAGISVYMAKHRTVGETLDALKADELELMQPGMACTQHGSQ